MEDTNNFGDISLRLTDEISSSSSSKRNSFKMEVSLETPLLSANNFLRSLQN